MPAPYAYPNSTTIGMVDIFTYINNALGGTGDSIYILTAAITLIVFAIIILYSLNNYNPETALAAASYISFIISIIFYYAGLMGEGLPILFATFSGIGTMYLWYKNK